jgi:hypothetical protein
MGLLGFAASLSVICKTGGAYTGKYTKIIPGSDG